MLGVHETRAWAGRITLANEHLITAGLLSKLVS